MTKRIGERVRMSVEIGRRQAGAVVRGQRVVGAEVTRQEDEIVMRPEECRGEVRRCPRPVASSECRPSSWLSESLDR